MPRGFPSAPRRRGFETACRNCGLPISRKKQAMSEQNDMTCAELADVAAELALGVLTGRERAMAVAHLDECDACREDVRHLMATGEQLLELLPPAEPPAGFETRVLERLGLPVAAPERQEP